jgi:hypothetical protein
MRKLAWSCKVCNWLTISSAEVKNQIDVCPCEQSSVIFQDVLVAEGCVYGVAYQNEKGIWVATDKTFAKKIKQNNIKYVNEQIDAMVEILKNVGVPDEQVGELLEKAFERNRSENGK